MEERVEEEMGEETAEVFWVGMAALLEEAVEEVGSTMQSSNDDPRIRNNQSHHRLW